MPIEVVKEHIAGSTVKILAYIQNPETETDVNVTACNIEILGPTGSTVQAATAMVNDSAGQYSFLYRTDASTAPLGWYPLKVDAVDGSGGTAIHSIEKSGFRLK